MKRNSFLLLIFFIVYSVAKAQDIKTITGTEYFSPSGKSCFNKLDWSLNYKYDCSDTETGTFILVFSDAKFSRASAKLFYNSKEYSPADAGLTEWPEEYTKFITVKFKLTVMHGNIILYEQEVSISNGYGQRIRVGFYRDDLFHTTGSNAQKLSGINYKNCTIKITNLTGDDCNYGAQPLNNILNGKM